jgi:hypothetical protein
MTLKVTARLLATLLIALKLLVYAALRDWSLFCLASCQVTVLPCSTSFLAAFLAVLHSLLHYRSLIDLWVASGDSDLETKDRR